jgi:hypothetical protein
LKTLNFTTILILLMEVTNSLVIVFLSRDERRNALYCAVCHFVACNARSFVETVKTLDGQDVFAYVT